MLFSVECNLLLLNDAKVGKIRDSDFFDSLSKYRQFSKKPKMHPLRFNLAVPPSKDIYPLIHDHWILIICLPGRNQTFQAITFASARTHFSVTGPPTVSISKR